ncbi:hypothetical protein LXL04_019725 [Taraxacum kok-saghyz]
MSTILQINFPLLQLRIAWLGRVPLREIKVKNRLRKLYTNNGSQRKRGYLLYGPSGTGKSTRSPPSIIH